MSDRLLHRDFDGELIVRAGADGEERIIEGVVIPYGQVATVRDSPSGPRYRETIMRGAAGAIVPENVQLEFLPRPPQGHNTHDGAVLVGAGTAADDSDERLHMSFHVSQTRDGDEALALTRDRVLRRMSATFRPLEERTRADGVVERTRIELRRVAVVGSAAYDAAEITAVRAGTEESAVAETTPAASTADTTEETTEDAQAETPTPPAQAGSRPNRTRVTVDVERQAAEERQRAGAERETAAELARSASAPRGGIRITSAPAVYGPHSDASFLRDFGAMHRGDMEAAERWHRHQARLAEVAQVMERSAGWDGTELHRASDVLTSEIPGAIPNEYLPGLLTPRILKGRPMGDFFDRFPITNANPKIFPKVTTSTSVAVQSAEGAALTGTDFATTAVTATPLIYGAFTDVSRQALDGADPAAQSMILADLLEAYAQASETVIKTAVEAGSTASGVAITAATPYAGTLANVINYYAVRFKSATGAFIPSALFPVLAAQGDTTGRPFLPMIGAVNSDGQTLAEDLSLDLAVLTARTKLSYASTVNVCVFGRPNDFVIYESAIAQFSYDQVVGPQAVRLGIWAYLVVGTRLGSLKVTAA